MKQGNLLGVTQAAIGSHDWMRMRVGMANKSNLADTEKIEKNIADARRIQKMGESYRDGVGVIKLEKDKTRLINRNRIRR